MEEGDVISQVLAAQQLFDDSLARLMACIFLFSLDLSFIPFISISFPFVSVFSSCSVFSFPPFVARS
eukprot:m.20939 g.20939  ORF g.20939 m.20939 type:complete len:67 (+) comp7953_c0_seq1:2470-2670(+)